MNYISCDFAKTNVHSNIIVKINNDIVWNIIIFDLQVCYIYHHRLLSEEASEWLNFSSLQPAIFPLCHDGL